MSEPQIVSCPGCGKRYSVPPGVAPGQFQCQDCSSVVVYGRGSSASEPPARPAGKGGAAARSHAKAAAAKRKNARNRREEEDDDGRDDRGRGQAGPKKQDPMLYVMALAGVVIVGGGIAFAVSKSSSKTPAVAQAPSGGKAEAPPAAGITAADGTGEERPAPAPSPSPSPSPAPRPSPAPSPAPAEGDEAPKPSGGLKAAVRGGVQDKADPFTPAANPPSGGLYGKSQAALLVMLRDKRSDVWIDPGHLPDTASDVAAKIDADIVKMADVNGGSESARAQDRLIKIGRPALPKVVGLTAKLDFSKYGSMRDAMEACLLGDAIDHVMREITGYDRIPMLQYSPMDGKLAQYTDSLDEWCLWWFTIGYKRETFYKKAASAEDEKL